MEYCATVLLVEPDVLIRHPLAEYLRECGYRVLEAFSAAEAKVLMDHETIEVDIVLANANEGFSLTGWLRAHHPDTKLQLAGSVTRAVEKAGDLCEESPDDEVLPYEHKLLLERIKRLLAGHARGK